MFTKGYIELNNQRGVVHLVLPLFLLLIAGVAVFILISLGIIKNPFRNLPVVGEKEPTVAIKQEYKNPFDKKSQYVNPFDQYKSPLLNLKK